MTATNPEIDRQLDALAELCCQALDREQPVINERSEQLLKSLLMSGYVRQTGSNLQADLEARANEKCREPAIHRGGALAGIVKQLQNKFDERIRWESNQPEQSTAPKAANISSETDA